METRAEPESGLASTFDITPCPVALFTFGLPLQTTAPVQRRLLLIPLAGSPLAGSAAFLLGIPQDWPLRVSGISIAPLVRRDRLRLVSTRS